MPKATADGGQVEADRDRRQRERAQDEDEDEEGGERDRGDDEGDPLPGDPAVVVELGGAAGDAGLEARFPAERRRPRLEPLVERDRAGRVEGEAGDHRIVAAWPPPLRSIASPARSRDSRPGAVERREDEVAGVEEAGRGPLQAPRPAVQRGAAGEHLDARAAQPGLQRAGARGSLGEALFQRFGAAARAGRCRRPGRWRRRRAGRRRLRGRPRRGRGGPSRGRASCPRPRVCCSPSESRVAPVAELLDRDGSRRRASR